MVVVVVLMVVLVVVVHQVSRLHITKGQGLPHQLCRQS